jgi:hypothetical protein
MITASLLVTAVLAAPAVNVRPAFLCGLGPNPPVAAAFAAKDQAALSDLAERVQSYMDLRRYVAQTVPPLTVSADPDEIRRKIDALATAIVTARHGARQGDIFSPETAGAVRRVVGSACQGRYHELLLFVTDEMEEPFPTAAIHARWPEGVPIPTMPVNVLAALPRLPAELQYRFMNRDLVLIDIGANLIVDVVLRVIPLGSSTE